MLGRLHQAPPRARSAPPQPPSCPAGEASRRPWTTSTGPGAAGRCPSQCGRAREESGPAHRVAGGPRSLLRPSGRGGWSCGRDPRRAPSRQPHPRRRRPGAGRLGHRGPGPARRDLWMLADGDRGLSAAYRDVTGSSSTGARWRPTGCCGPSAMPSRSWRGCRASIGRTPMRTARSPRCASSSRAGSRPRMQSSARGRSSF